MKEDIVVDLKKYKKLYTKKTILYLLIYPFILVCILFILGLVVQILNFNPIYVDIATIFSCGLLILSPITTYSFYSGNKNKYKSTKFVLNGDTILFILLKERNLISGGTFFYHNIHSVSNYTITNDKITISGNITKSRFVEKYPSNRYKERKIESFSVSNVFGNVQYLEEALKNKKEGAVTDGS